MAAKKKLTDEERLEAALVAARAALQAKGVATGPKLGPPALRPTVVHRLSTEGFEPTASGVRVPLDVQGDRWLAAGEPIALAAFGKRLSGAKAPEVKALAQRMAEQDKVAIVLRGKQLWLVPSGAGGQRVLGRNTLKQAVAKLKALSAWLDKAYKDKLEATVLEADFAAELEAVGALMGATALEKKGATPSRGETAAGGEALSHALRGAILALRDEDSALASVPQVSRRLRDRATANEVIDLLLSEFRQGHVELRPEGGIGRLGDEERALCPVGAGGVPLSGVRLLED